MTAAAGSAPRRKWRSVVPGISTLAGYRPEWLRGDLAAGITLGAYLVPAGIADASLAGVPPEAGLYACLFGGALYWLFCSSRHAVVTVTSAISLLIGSSLQGLDLGDPSRHATLAAATAIIVGVIGLIAWLLRAGVLVSLISETVLIGFKCGVALHIASTQLPKLFGFGGGHGDFWERAHVFFSRLDQTNGAALAVGVTALAILLAGKKLAPRVPFGLIVVVLGIVVAGTAHLADRGVKLLGHVPQGLPPIKLPDVAWQDVNDLLPLAMACFLLGAVETAAIGRMFARKHGYRFDPNQEFLALAAANVSSGLGSGFPISGGMSQSLVNESSGARTSISGLTAAAVVLLVVLFLSPLMADLPQPVLAAIILLAVAGLVKIDALKRIWHFSKAEFAVSMAALLGVLGSGLLRGVLIGAVISVVMLLRRGSRPPVAELGRVPGSTYFANRALHPENEVEPGVMVFRVSGPLLYFNAEWVSDCFFEKLNARDEPASLAVFFFGNVPAVDLAGCEMLVELQRDLRARGVAFRLAEVHGTVRKSLKRAGYPLDDGIGKHQTVDAVVSAWRNEMRRTSP